MRIRAKLTLVVLPLVIVAVVITGGASMILATTSVSRVAQEFLNFKAFELENYAESQWNLLVQNDLVGNAAFEDAAAQGVFSFAESIVRTDTELTLAVDAAGSVIFATAPVNFTDEERTALADLFAAGSREFQTVALGGRERVARGFPFAPLGWFVLVTELRDVFYRDVTTIGVVTGSLILVMAGISLLALLLLSTRLTRPLSAMATTMERVIATSDLSERVPVEFTDETGRLAVTFNTMTEGLQSAYDQIKSFAYHAVVAEKREAKIRNIFQKYVPQELIDRFFQNPESMLVGEDRNLAILFSDIRGFTTISEALAPADLVRTLNRYFNNQVDAILKHRGIVDKYIGDAIMAFFGAPVAHPDDADEAVLAAIEMMIAADSFNEAQREHGQPEFRIGLGLSYGEVTVGNIGTDKKMDYTVIGDLVNLASRLEGLNKAYGTQLLVSEHVRDAATRPFHWRLIDMVAVKGKTRGVRIYTAAEHLEPEVLRAYELHNDAMEDYFARRFESAAEKFSRVVTDLPEDRPSQILRDRSRAYSNDPPPDGWSGVEVMKTK